jgi:hypothetical protein
MGSYRLALAAGLGAAACLAAPQARAMNGTTNIQIDGGPLGPLEISGGIDGYFYYQSGTSDTGNSIAGPKQVGAELNTFDFQVEKTTGIIQFEVQLTDYGAIELGASHPKEANISHFTDGPLRAANITIQPPNSPFSITAGQVGSLEGYESTFPWNDPTGLYTILYYVTNSESRGVSLNYNQGPVSGTVTFGDGNDTGVWNYLQFLGTYNFDSNNNINVFGGVELGVTGPDAYGYGQTTTGGNGLYNVDCNVYGAWYSTTIGNLSLTPEVQYQYSNPLHRYASSGNDIPKYTSDFGAAIFADYLFGTSPYSIGAWVQYATSVGSADWFVAPHAQLVGASVAPTWQYKDVYVRFNMGYNHLLNGSYTGTGLIGEYGDNGTGRDQFIGTLEGGLVF